MFARCKAGLSSIVKGAGYLLSGVGTAGAFAQTLAFKPHPYGAESWVLLITFLTSSAAATADLTYSGLSSLIEGLKKYCAATPEFQPLEGVEIEDMNTPEAKVENPSSPSSCSPLKGAVNLGLGVTTGVSTLLAAFVTWVTTVNVGDIGSSDGPHPGPGVTAWTVLFGFYTLSLLVGTGKFFANGVNNCQPAPLHNSRNTLFGAQGQARLLEQNAVQVTEVKSENSVRPGQG